jgi:hypothetical protein
MESRAGKTTFRTDHGASETISFFSHSLRKFDSGRSRIGRCSWKTTPASGPRVNEFRNNSLTFMKLESQAERWPVSKGLRSCELHGVASLTAADWKP